MGAVCCAQEPSKELAPPEVAVVSPTGSQAAVVASASSAKPVAAEGSAQAAAEETPALTPKLTVAIVGARGLRNADWLPGMGKSDCFCTLRTAGADKDLHGTKVQSNTLEPVWNEEVDVVEYNMGDPLMFSVWDADMAGRDFLGKVTLKGEDFNGIGFNGEVQLEEAGKNAIAYLRLKVKMAGQEYPPGPPQEITVTVEREPKKLTGLELDLQDGVFALVTAVKAGPFAQFNASAKPAEQLMPGDFIMQVNGATGNVAQIAEQLKKNGASKLEVLVRRPVEMGVIIDRQDPKKPLGLEFPKKLSGNFLLVTKVEEGPFQDWNAANPSREVRVGDRIVAVGGVRGTAAQLVKKLKSAGKVQVTVVRPACPKSSWWLW